MYTSFGNMGLQWQLEKKLIDGFMQLWAYHIWYTESLMKWTESKRERQKIQAHLVFSLIMDVIHFLWDLL